MGRKKRDTSLKKASIMQAAIRAFQEEGYDKTSMDRIAEVAGASKRTVYNHFASKDALFKAVINRFMGEISALKQIPYDAGQSLEEQLTLFAETKLSILDNPAWMGLFKVGLGVLVRDPELARESLAQAETGEDYLADWLQAATADGRLDVQNPALAAEIFWAMLSGAFIWPHLIQGPMEAAHIQSLKEELIQTFLARYRVGA